MKYRHRLYVIYSIFNHAKFVIIEKIKLSRSAVPPMKILFSVVPEWEKKIKIGFWFSKHRIYFEAFTPENFADKDLIVPLNIPDLLILNRNRKWIENNPIPIPVAQVVELCDNKYLFIQKLIKGGYAGVIPQTGDNLPYPYMLKKKFSSYGRDCYIIADDSDALKYRELMKDESFFCQEIISSVHEFATHIVFTGNEIKASLTIKYRYPTDSSINGKDKFIVKNVVGCPFLPLFSEILTYIGYEGQCCFDYKVVNGKPYIFEINPRFGGSVCRFFFSFINKRVLRTP